MLSALHDRFRRALTRRVLGLLAIAFVLCQAGFVLLWWQFGLPADVPDLRPGYGPGDLRERFDRWGADGRRAYVATALTLDAVVPVVYALLFAGGTVRLLGGRAAPWVIVPALVAGAADLAENAALAYLAWSYDGRAAPLAWVACALTLTKFGAAAVALGLLAFAALRRAGDSGSQR